jgi:hypothetical protein
MAKGDDPMLRQNSWTTREQWDWLISKKPDYLKARSVGKRAIADFWVSTFENWVAAWPYEPLTKQEDPDGLIHARRVEQLKTVSSCYADCCRLTNFFGGGGLKRIKQWFNNNSRASSSGEGRRALIDLKVKPKKKLPAYQAYQKLYESKIKAVVKDEWPDEWKSSEDYAEGKALPPPSIKFQNTIALRLLDEESQQVKDKVEKYCTDRGDGGDIDEEDAGDDDPAVRDEKKRVAKAKAFQR